MSGTIIAASSSSWFSCWLGLEINLMRIIPILITKSTPSTTESRIKYFITQALASVVIIASATSIFFYNFSNFFSLQPLLLVSGIGIKLGAAPLHFWLPQVIQTSDWPQILILLTWQKLAPIVLIMFSSSQLIFILILASCLVGVLGAINQTSFKKILVYSSILHSAWILTATLCSEIIWWFYFVIYSVISTSVILPIISIPFTSVKQLFSPLLPNNLALIIFLNFFFSRRYPSIFGILYEANLNYYFNLSWDKFHNYHDFNYYLSVSSILLHTIYFCLHIG